MFELAANIAITVGGLFLLALLIRLVWFFRDLMRWIDEISGTSGGVDLFRIPKPRGDQDG